MRSAPCDYAPPPPARAVDVRCFTHRPTAPQPRNLDRGSSLGARTSARRAPPGPGREVSANRET